MATRSTFEIPFGEGDFMKRTFMSIGLASLMIAMACSKQPETTKADTFEPRSNAAPAVAAAPEQPEPTVTTVPAGAKLRVVLMEAVSSDKSQSGDAFMASLAEPVVVDGKTVFAKG